jgi:hypothetical protein
LAIFSLLAGLPGGLRTAHAQADFDAVALEIQAVRSADAVYVEHFRVNDGAWNTEASMSVVPYYQTGTLHIAILDPQTVGYSMSEWEAGDFHLEVDSYHVEGPLDNEIGVVFRYVDELNFYYFSISSNGYYAFHRYVDGEWQALIDWTASDVIETGEGAANWLGVYAFGTQITLLVNDYMLEIVEDDTFDYGGIGLAAGASDEASVAIAFDDLSLWDAHITEEPVSEATATQMPTVTPVPATVTPAPATPTTNETQPLTRSATSNPPTPTISASRPATGLSNPTNWFPLLTWTRCCTSAFWRRTVSAGASTSKRLNRVLPTFMRKSM